jgi:glycosyltransferase involved in cell wall biosynthesis
VPTVAFDITPGLLIRTGIGRYPRALPGRLQALPDIEVIRIAATRSPATGRSGRIAQGVIREGVWYPALAGRRAKRAGADVLHCPHPVPARGGRIPLVVTVHDLLPLRHPELFPHVTVAHTRLSLPFARRAWRLLTNSEHTRAEVIERLSLPPERVVATPFGVDSRFRPVEVERDWLRKRFGVERSYVLSVGTVEPRKNVLATLRAFRLAGERLSEHDLVVVGGAGWGVGAGLMEEAARALPRRPVLTGFVSDDELVRLYSAASCFVFPSLSEGFGFPPLEAMACGAPVVAGDRPALPEVLGDAGLLVDPTNPEEIAEAIVSVLESEEFAAGLRRRGLKRSARFTWERCAELTAAVYREVAAEAG